MFDAVCKQGGEGIISKQAGATYRFFFFNDTATTEIYTLSLHDALPIWPTPAVPPCSDGVVPLLAQRIEGDRKSTRLNPSHLVISYAVFCLKKKKLTPIQVHPASAVRHPRLIGSRQSSRLPRIATIDAGS